MSTSGFKVPAAFTNKLRKYPIGDYTSVTEIAKDLEVDRRYVNAAMIILKEEGLVESAVFRRRSKFNSMSPEKIKKWRKVITCQ